MGRFKISEDGVEEIVPQVQKTEGGKVVLLGTCYVKDDELGCYNWENNDILWIFDFIPESDDDLPVNQYYCYNWNKKNYGWAFEGQVKEICMG